MESTFRTPLVDRLLAAVGEREGESINDVQMHRARLLWDPGILDELTPWRNLAEDEVRQCLDQLAQIEADDLKPLIAELRENPLRAPLYTLLLSSRLAPKKPPRAAIRIIRDHSDVMVTNPYCAARALAGLLVHQEDSSYWAYWWPPSDSENSKALKIANALNTIAHGIINGPPIDLPPLPPRFRHGYSASAARKARRSKAAAPDGRGGEEKKSRKVRKHRTTRISVQIVRHEFDGVEAWGIFLPDEKASGQDSRRGFDPKRITPAQGRIVVIMHDEGRLTSRCHHINALIHNVSKTFRKVFKSVGKSKTKSGQYDYELGSVGISLDIDRSLKTALLEQYHSRACAGERKKRAQD